jgi:hypothetical protein
MYAFTENFILPLSHDEVVHGKGSLISKMAGDYWQKFANLRSLYGFMWAHPGKKLLFMGGEIGQWNEWNHDASLDWGLLDFPLHAGVRDLIRDLNRIYRSNPALHEVDFEPAGFEWIAADDADCSVVAFVRWARDRSRAILYVGNFTPVVRHGYRIGVPMPAGIANGSTPTPSITAAATSATGFEPVHAEQVPAHGREWSLNLTCRPSPRCTSNGYRERRRLSKPGGRGRSAPLGRPRRELRAFFGARRRASSCVSSTAAGCARCRCANAATRSGTATWPVPGQGCAMPTGCMAPRDPTPTATATMAIGKATASIPGACCSIPTRAKWSAVFVADAGRTTRALPDRLCR